MKYILVISDAALEPLAQRLFAATSRSCAADRVYRIYRVEGTDDSYDFNDVDGTMLVSYRVFDSESEAKTFAARDAEQRLSILQMPVSGRPS